jgi:hypothetical protein
MQGTSREFQDLVRGPHHVRSRIDVIRDDQYIRSLDAIAGAVNMDRSAKYQRRFSATVVDPDGSLTPGEMRDLLAPFGTEVRVYRGALITGTKEALDIDTTQAQFAEGTHTNTIAHASGDLILD